MSTAASGIIANETEDTATADGVDATRLKTALRELENKNKHTKN